MVGGLPQTVGFQASLILIQPGGSEPAQTFCVRDMAAKANGGSAGLSVSGDSRDPAGGGHACGGAAGRPEILGNDP